MQVILVEEFPKKKFYDTTYAVSHGLVIRHERIILKVIEVVS